MLDLYFLTVLFTFKLRSALNSQIECESNSSYPPNCDLIYL